jgi:heme exporter protein A
MIYPTGERPGTGGDSKVDPAAPWAIELAEVSRRFGHRTVLASVSLKVAAGESVALLGQNGAGKTTLLRIIATQLSPSSGRVMVFGEDARGRGGDLRRRIGFVSHGSFLYDELTVGENLRHYARLFGVEPGAAGPLDLVTLLGLRHLVHTEVKELSHGFRKRADIVRALLHTPDILLLDEPFSGLDEETGTLLAAYLRERQGQGMTVLLSSHDREWARRACTRGILLARGSITEERLAAGGGVP